MSNKIMNELDKILSKFDPSVLQEIINSAKYPPIHLAVDGIATDLFNQLNYDEIHLRKVLTPLVTII